MYACIKLTIPGSAFLDKSLFTTYTFHAPPPQQRQSIDSDDEDEDNDDLNSTPTFQISLPSLLETLQILGLTDPNNNKPPWARENLSSTAFSNNVLGMNNMCRISYDGLGAPLSIILTESTIRTTCNLTTYEPAFNDEIPFDRQALAFKTIMRGSWLFDAISELNSTTPERLTLVAKTSKGKPFFALSASGPLGSARVEFNNTPTGSLRAPPPQSTVSNLNSADAPDPTQANLLETFQLTTSPLRTTYKFSLIQKAAKAMSLAAKVSVRVDSQGVLSLQFMIEVEAGKASFVDYRFVPLVEDNEDNGEETFIGQEKGDDSGSGEESQDEDDMVST